jgi:hypothetical protein
MITYEQALGTLQELVAEKGEDFVYRSADGACTYSTVEGESSCGVGYVIEKLDRPVFDMIRVAEWGEAPYLEHIPHQFPVSEIEEYISWTDEDGSLYDDKAAHLLAAFQSHQDVKTPYGQALEDAISDVYNGDSPDV